MIKELEYDRTYSVKLFEAAKDLINQSELSGEAIKHIKHIKHITH